MFCCQAKKLPKKGRVALKFRKNRPEMSKIEQKWPKNAQFSLFLGKIINNMGLFLPYFPDFQKSSLFMPCAPAQGFRPEYPPLHTGETMTS